MRIELATVFGGSGFLGRYIVRELARGGARVRAAVRRPEQAGFLKPMGAVGQVMPVAANVRDDASVAAAVAGADVVINLVGLLYESGRQRFAAVHVEGARRVAEAADRAGAERFVHVSAIGAAADSPSLYGRTKAEGEQAVRDAFPEATIVRPSILFGPEDDFFNKFAAIARLVWALPLPGGGRTRFEPVYVGDVADGVMAVLADPATRGKVCEFGGPQIFTYRELMAAILTMIGRRRLLVPVPFAVMELLALPMELLPVPPVTRDQLRSLRRDYVVSGNALTLADLAIAPVPLDTIVPSYLARYARHGHPGAGPHVLA